jgi:polar amino acid transport system substrate-binding protein
MSDFTSLLVRALVVAQLCLFTQLAFGVTEMRTAAQNASEPKFIALVDEDGRKSVGGICIDIMRAMERIAPEIRFVGDQTWQPLKRLEAMVENGNLDVACGLLHGVARETKFNYIEPPLFPVNYYLIVREDDDVQVENWNDVRKLGAQGVILVINGFGIINRLNELGGLTIDSGAYDSKANLDKLLARRGRFYLHRSPGINAEIRKAGMQGKVKILPTPMHTESFHMVVSKKLPAETVEAIRKAIVTLDRNGELKRIVDKWNDY